MTGATTVSTRFEQYLRDATARAEAVDTATLATLGLLPTPTEHYLSGTYPPLKAMDDADEAEVLRGTSAELNLYVHIPFCRQRCTFCHFAKEIRATEDRVTAYLDALVHEIALQAKRLGPRWISSVYFGGGTPSTLTPAELERLFGALHEHFGWTAETEVTFELHPQVVRDRRRLTDQLAVLKSGGVNRIAFGIQSLDDKVLSTMNRGHTAAEAFALIDFLQHTSFDNVSVDLMYGLPYETTESWFRTLNDIVAAGVEKLNIFPLFLKVTDPISWLYERRPEVFPDGRDRLVSHLITEDYLRDQGFHSGPVLYYARADHHSRQQASKFDEIDSVNLLGLGVSSFGYLGGTQYYNHCDLDTYLSQVMADRLPFWRAFTLPEDELARRNTMFALRSAGVHRSSFADRFGAVPEDLLPELKQFADLGLLELTDDVWRTNEIGAYCIDSMSAQLASDDIVQRVRATNEQIVDPRRNLLEQHDYSPLGRTGASVARPHGPGRR
ncbi:coproporphyrinogen-III oxidase family protein [Kribbella sp. CA-253562]|uniref:coproporphyrinogen-III oxidase family protein n=1 Tax=Kribbella sp. CA-253562 TaxID=3239942 RepID=UPI003D8B5FB0